MEDFKEKANELLKSSYGSARSGKAIPPKILPCSDTPDIWKILANERLQMMEQLRDEMHAWYDAYEKERERSDMFASLLLKNLGAVEEIKEVKHTVNTSEQVNRKRANWPHLKAEMERKFRVGQTGEIIGEPA
jgi:hypothetical protein